MANMDEFNDYDTGWYDGDDLREMGDREAWEDSRDLGDLHDLEDEDCEYDDLDYQVAPECDW